ncbi:xylanase [Streptomyces sp. RKND-216]|uniref:polysaccharide deacetylase family protein n=1 Tax=Streptomyces sp. RKND-216 TaxID=2562581 RepID=UPI00109D9855|nr:polysaccharide deacetylase family protein [Streptomyces sp. RKND-216]THA24962.1 xylanase [Streptomyces sp. RKND-216]
MVRPLRLGAAAAAAALLTLAGCAGSTSSDEPEDRKAERAPGAADTAGGERDSPSPSPSAPDPAAVDADELGAVPVLMYHQIVDDPQSIYDRTPEDFEAELERLAREDYVPVTARELTGGRIDIPAGTHPVVLTFDDSTVSQLALDAAGKPERDTAVAVLRDVAEKHPDFRPVATFFVNGDPFAEPGGQRTLGWLHDHGFEIGNHTLRHTTLGTVSGSEVQRAVARNQKAITDALPDDVTVDSLALPNGSMPSAAGLAVEGSSGGTDYRHAGVYLVGANPAPSPFSSDFDPAAIPRIRSQGPDGPDAKFASAAWLDKLADGTVARYTSDGDPDRVSFPADRKPSLAAPFENRAQPY